MHDILMFLKWVTIFDLKLRYLKTADRYQKSATRQLLGMIIGTVKAINRKSIAIGCETLPLEAKMHLFDQTCIFHLKLIMTKYCLFIRLNIAGQRILSIKRPTLFITFLMQWILLQ